MRRHCWQLYPFWLQTHTKSVFSLGDNTKFLKLKDNEALETGNEVLSSAFLDLGKHQQALPHLKATVQFIYNVYHFYVCCQEPLSSSLFKACIQQANTVKLRDSLQPLLI